MTTFNIILAQTMAGTIIEIIVLLLVAGLIGYFTSYFYYRNIYRKNIAKLESDIKDLQKRNEGLLDQIVKLEKKLEEKES